MNRAMVVAALVGLAVSPMMAGGNSVTGEYVEARTAEVFAGGCIMNGEAVTTGREALLAWKVTRGSFNGVRSTASRSSPRSPATRTSASASSVANKRQPARRSSSTSAPRRAAARRSYRWRPRIRRASSATSSSSRRRPSSSSTRARRSGLDRSSRARGGARDESRPDLRRQAVVPPARGRRRAMGTADENAFSGSALGTKWSDPNKRSSFFGTFVY